MFEFRVSDFSEFSEQDNPVLILLVEQKILFVLIQTRVLEDTVAIAQEGTKAIRI